jgi:hypothetical protein
MRLVITVLSAPWYVILLGCTVAPHWSNETDYPGSAIAKVVRRNDVPSTPLVEPSEKPLSINIVNTRHGPLPVVTGDGSGLVRSTARFDYELRTNDGTLLIVQSESAFEVGACLAVTGYADGPSRTHYSLGRARLERSDRCEQ